ncbi:MAG: hypothetical protein NTW94_07375 [Legionellales bacterium]|nr:hypothetical protein [Legionellales bacterium]
MDKRSVNNVEWRRYKISRLMVSDYYFKLGLVVAISDRLLEEQYAVDLAARVSHPFFCLQDRIFCLNTRDERMGFSSDLKMHAHTSWALLNLMLSIPLGAVEPQICVRNKNRREEIFWPAPLTETEAPYLYPWTSKKGPMPTELVFQTYVTAGEVFGWSLEGVFESGTRVPMIKHDVRLGDEALIVGIAADGDCSPYEAFLFKSLGQFAAFMQRSSVTGEIIDFVYHLPYYDHILLGVGLFVSNKMTLSALDLFLKCILDKCEKHMDRIQEIFLTSELKATLDIIMESPFVGIFGPIDSLLERVGWDVTREGSTELAVAILSYLDIPSSIPSEEISIYERQLLRTCKQRLLERHEYTEGDTFFRALHHAWSDYGLDDIDTLADLLKLGSGLIIAASAHGKQGERICSWLPMSEQENALGYDRYLPRLNRRVTCDGAEAKTSEEEGPYPSIMNLVLLEPALYTPANKSGNIFRDRSACRKAFVSLVDSDLLDFATRNALTFSEGTSQSLSLTDAFSSIEHEGSDYFFGDPEAMRILSDSSLDPVTQMPVKKLPFMDFHTFFPWISRESEKTPVEASSKDKVRFLLQRSKKEVFDPKHFRSSNDFNFPEGSDIGNDALQYRILSATFHKEHINATRFIINAKNAKKAAITFDRTPPLLSSSLIMLAMLPEEYSCRKICLDHILKNAKNLVSETLVQLIVDDHLTFDEASELIQELLEATSKLTPFFTLLYSDKETLLSRTFITFCTSALETNLKKSAAALNVIYDEDLLSASTLVEMIKKLPKCHWRIVVVSMLTQYPEKLSKYILLAEIAEFDQETLFRDAESLLDLYEDLSPRDREWVIENEIKPFKEYLVTTRTLSADELAVLQYYFLGRKEIVIAHLSVEEIHHFAQGFVDKFIIDGVECDGCEELSELVSERHGLQG